VATAAEDRLKLRRNPHTSFAAASDCRTIAVSPNAIACARGRRGFKKLEAANLGPRRREIFSKLPEKQIREI
jgi:hypothetical protein